MAKIGIFSGSFDPVHEGHISFALQAIETAGLDQVFFAPEPNPRRKYHVAHIAHRVSMLEEAVAPHSHLKVLELPDKQFTPAKTVSRLRQRFPGDELYYLCGSDMLEHMPEWPLVDRMLDAMGLVVGLRQGTSKNKVAKLIQNLPVGPKGSIQIKSTQNDISSRAIRQAIDRNVPAKGLLPSTEAYIKKNWLYSEVSPAASPNIS